MLIKWYHTKLRIYDLRSYICIYDDTDDNIFSYTSLSSELGKLILFHLYCIIVCIIPKVWLILKCFRARFEQYGYVYSFQAAYALGSYAIETYS